MHEKVFFQGTEGMKSFFDGYDYLSQEFRNVSDQPIDHALSFLIIQEA